MDFISHVAQVSQSPDLFNSPSPADTSATDVGLLIITLFVLIVIVLTYVLTSFVLGRIFKKAGVAQWIAWVPFYNNWKMLELGDQEGFWAVLALIPFVNIASAVFMYIAMYNIGLKLGKESWFVLLAIFIPIVWTVWLAFDGSKWKTAENTEPPFTPSVTA